MSTQKTPEQWFQQLKEPYRSEAIKGINKEVLNFKEYPESLTEALYFSLHWGEPYETTRNDWDVIYNSIRAGETTYLEPENVSLINEVNNSQVTEQQNEKWSKKIDEIIDTHVVQKLKHEHIELRPEDLVIGEVYKATDEKHGHWWIFQHLESNTKYVIHSRCIDYEKDFEGKGEFIANNFKYYHATPEEKKLLLGEEQTIQISTGIKSEDTVSGEAYNEMVKCARFWEKRFKEYESTSKKEYVEMKKELIDRNNELYSKNEELQAKINQLEPKGEKVHFYTDHNGSLRSANDIEIVKTKSGEDYKIYEAVCIGKKKSVLIDEL